MPYKYPDSHPAVSGGVTNDTAKLSVTLEWFDKVEKMMSTMQWFMKEMVGNDDGNGVFVTEGISGILSGKVKATVSPSMSVYVYGGAFFVDSVPFKLPTPVTSAAITAPISGDRIDVVAASAEDGAFVILHGAEASTPIAPSLTTGMVELAQIYLRPGMTTILDEDTTAATEGYITDTRNLLNA